MIITKQGYSVYHRGNQIIIGLPQTELSATNTVGPFGKRSEIIPNSELMFLLNLVILMFTGGDHDAET